LEKVILSSVEEVKQRGWGTPFSGFNMKKYNTCPKCGSVRISDRWCEGRMIQQYCYDDGDDEDFGSDVCGWVGKPRIPETRSIKISKKLIIDGFTGWHYEVYDKYGHVMISSRYYDKKEDAQKNLESDLEKGLKDEAAGPYTAVLFNIPSSVVIEGQVFKKH